MFAGEFESSSRSFVTSLLLVFLIAIVLLNLLKGLAMGDTEKITKIVETVIFMARSRRISNAFE